MRSISQRLSISLTITTVVTSLCAFGWIYLQARSTENALRERTLLDQARLIANYLVVDKDGAVQLPLPATITEAYRHPDNSLRYAVREQNGQIVFSSGLSVGPMPIFGLWAQTVYNYDPDGPGPVHMFGAAERIPLGSHNFTVQVEQTGLDEEYLRAAVIEEFLTDGGLLQIPFLLTWLGVGIYAVRRAVEPLKQLSRVAESIGTATSDVRLPVDNVPREVLPLVAAINLALDRLEQGLRSQREFNANAAHQLRTPLSVLAVNIEAMQDKATAAKLNYDVELMSRIVKQLLLMARLETLAIANNETVDLAVVAAEVATNLAPLAIANGRHLEVLNPVGPVRVCANNEAVRTALSNLVENALSHTPPKTTVSIRLSEPPALEVSDCGPGVPPDQRDHVFERFWKSDRNSKGAGLGLAIVKHIMTALHGSVSVSDHPGGGAAFTLRFSEPSVATRVGQPVALA
jgi:signal transduction histidine kinase